MSKLVHLVIVYFGSYFLCLDVNYHIRTLKNRLDRSLQVKIMIFHKKTDIWVDTLHL